MNHSTRLSGTNKTQPVSEGAWERSHRASLRGAELGREGQGTVQVALLGAGSISVARGDLPGGLVVG